jgi:hypothetical protein
MSDLSLHIISFDIPFPANYGGVIDVFYKIRALHAAGVKVHLHCFKYHRGPAKELEALCETVTYYKRRTGMLAAMSWKPYIVYGRRSRKLLENLCKNDFPILFEGLHSCYYLSHPKLQGRVKIYRESNIEHHYYYHLSRAETNFLKKLYYIVSGIKLSMFQHILKEATLMLAVSIEDQNYLQSRFPGNRIEYLPSFHPDNDVSTIQGTGGYALYHGHLSVPENSRAAEYLIREVFGKSPFRLVIAGLNPPSRLKELIRQHANVTLHANPDDEAMVDLIRNAQVNILITFQGTGLKLKLLKALFNGRFCLVNPEMVTGTMLGDLCEIGSSTQQLEALLDRLMTLTFSPEDIRFRRERLLQLHSNDTHCSSLLNFISLLYRPSS